MPRPGERAQHGALNLAAAISISVASVGVALAMLTLRISYGPGLREFRWFAVCALLASAFCGGNAAVTLTTRASVLVPAARVTMAIAALHGAAWYAYFAAQERRPLSRGERVVAAGAVACALLSLVPGVAMTEHVVSRPVPWLAVTYTDAVPTPVGQLFFAYYCFGLAVLVVRYAWAALRREQSALAHLVGLAALFAAAVSDSLAASGLHPLPYVIDLGLATLVVSVASVLSARFVDDARTLERAAERLVATQRELVARERLAALGEMSAVVAHEVRNPLGVIFNAVAGLRRAPLASQHANDLLAIVQEEAERLKRMVAELLDFARPREVRFERVSVASVVASAVEAARRASSQPAEATQVEVALDDAVVACDPQLVRQALINLVTNALQAPGRRRAVRVEAKVEAGVVAIAVIDDGEGVAGELVGRIFTPFFTTRATGTGLGLSIVQRVAELHGGDVACEATPGGGATFRLRIRALDNVAVGPREWDVPTPEPRAATPGDSASP